MSWFDRLHQGYVHSRRVDVLSDRLAALLPPSARVLDVGSGDGRVASSIRVLRPAVDIRGIDVLVREDSAIEVEAFDGATIPFPDESFDAVLLVDVVHHASEPMALLREAVRVSRQSLLIKDHTLEGWWAGPTLRFMDRVGNARHGVALPFEYWTRARWISAFETLGLSVVAWSDRLGLYPIPARWVFDRSLHFLARLDRTSIPRTTRGAIATSPPRRGRPGPTRPA